MAPEVVFNFPFEVEHPIPTSRHGSEDEFNLALACRACNVFKGDHITGTDGISGNVVQLFNPRLDNWADHFRVDAASGEICGTTPVGRATVERLRMNNAGQMAARKLWIGFGLFP
jgi:hypothetical protein